MVRRSIALGLALLLVSCSTEPEPTLCDRLPGTAYETVKGYGTGPGGGLANLPLYFATDGVVYVSAGDYIESGPYVCEGQIATATLLDSMESEFEFDAEGTHVVHHSGSEDTEYVIVNCSLTGAERSDACDWGASKEP